MRPPAHEWALGLSLPKRPQSPSCTTEIEAGLSSTGPLPPMGTNRALAGWVAGCIYNCGLWKWFRAMVNYLFCGCSLAEVCGYGLWLRFGSCLAAICDCRLVAIVQPQRTWEEELVDEVLLEAAAQKGPPWGE